MPPQPPHPSPRSSSHPDDSFLDSLVRPFFKAKSDEEFNANPKISTPAAFLAKLRADITDDAQFQHAQERLLALLDQTRQYAKGRGIDNLEFRISQDAHEAFTSSSGKHYVVLNESELRAVVTSDNEAVMRMAKGIVAHEVAHLAEGDTRPFHNGVLGNLDAAQRRAEIVADITGTGPLGSKDPQALAEYFRATLYLTTKAMNWQESTESDMRAASAIQHHSNDRRHPPLADRIDYLERAAQLMKEYEATHSVVTQEDRKKQSDWLVQQILREYDEGKIPHASLALKSASAPQQENQPVQGENLPADVKQQVEGMGKLPMSDADKAPKPVTPAAPVQDVLSQER